MKRVIFLIISTILHTTLWAQEADTTVVSISCIDYEANHIEFNDADWAALFTHMAHLQDTSTTQPNIISIVHLGDSHVQAGFFSEALRIPLQAQWGNAGRGFVTPLKLTNTNEPTDYSITSPDKWSYYRCVGGNHFSSNVGLSGIAIIPVTEHVDLTFETLSRTGEDVSFNTLRLFHADDANFPQLFPEIDEASMRIDFSQNGETRYTWAASLCLCSMRLQGANSGDNAHAAIYGASLENGHNGILLHTIGNNSATYECYNKVDNYASKLSRLSPHIIIISMGTNESVSNTFSGETLYNQIDRLVTSLQQEIPNALILLTTPGDNMIRSNQRNKRTYKTNPHISTAAETIKRYGADKHIAVWDWFTISGGLNSCGTWVKENGMSKDHIHYTPMGYAIQGNLLYQSIYNAYERYIQ